MRIGNVRKGILGIVVLIVSSGLWAGEHYKVVNGPKDFYYGHISYIETAPGGADPVVLREGQLEPEQAVLNLPIGPGDTVRTSADKRCEIQFDTGTIVRLDFNTTVRVETILARSLSSLEALSNLALDKGRVYIMYKEYDRHEMFQVLTPNAAVKLKHKSVAVIAAAGDGSTETQIKLGKARVLLGASATLLAEKAVRKGERLIVQKDDQFHLAPAIAESAFDLWNKDVNAHFEDLHSGLTALPKPIQKLPEAVFHFAQTYGNRYGEWLWDDYYGYVWRPFIDSGMYPWGWQPYYYGQWNYAAGQMFWVGQEPWGWIPYHLGVWQWDKKHGWVWLPGSLFAPAWATWDFYFGYACWRPWSLYDWILWDYGMSYSGFFYANDGWAYNWPFDDGPPDQGVKPILNVIRKDQLKQPVAEPNPAPPEFMGTLERVTAAFKRGDGRIKDSAREVPRQLVFVAKGDLKARAVNEKALTWDQMPKSGFPPAKENGLTRHLADLRREAVAVFRGAEAPAAVPQNREAPALKSVPVAGLAPSAVAVAYGRLATPVRRADGPAARFRDWNPDIRVAREVGVRIEYSSARNEVRCPELGISSRDREHASGFAPTLTSHGLRYEPVGLVSRGDSSSGGGGGSSSGGGGGSSSSGTRDSTSSSSASHHGSGGSEARGAGQGGSERIRN